MINSDLFINIFIYICLYLIYRYMFYNFLVYQIEIPPNPDLRCKKDLEEWVPHQQGSSNDLPVNEKWRNRMSYSRKMIVIVVTILSSSTSTGSISISSST